MTIIAVASSRSFRTQLIPSCSAGRHLLAHLGKRRASSTSWHAALRPAQTARAEQRFFWQRGGPRRQAKGSHGRPLLTDAGQVSHHCYLPAARPLPAGAVRDARDQCSIGKAITAFLARSGDQGAEQ